MNKKIVKVTIYTIVIIFLCSYFIETTGYYEYNLQNRKNLTEEGIKQFEQDIKEGKEIDLNDYLATNNIDYSNELTRTTSQASIKLNNYLKEFLTNGFGIFEKLVK